MTACKRIPPEAGGGCGSDASWRSSTASPVMRSSAVDHSRASRDQVEQRGQRHAAGARARGEQRQVRALDLARHPAALRRQGAIAARGVARGCDREQLLRRGSAPPRCGSAAAARAAGRATSRRRSRRDRPAPAGGRAPSARARTRRARGGSARPASVAARQQLLGDLARQSDAVAAAAGGSWLRTPRRSAAAPGRGIGCERALCGRGSGNRGSARSSGRSRAPCGAARASVVEKRSTSSKRYSR